MKLFSVVFFTAALIVSASCISIPFCSFTLPIKKLLVPTKSLNISQFNNTIRGGKDFQYDMKDLSQTQSTRSRINLWDKVTKLFAAGFGISRFSSISRFSTDIKVLQNDFNYFVDLLTFAISNVKITQSRSSISGDFIQRPKIEEKIRYALTNKPLHADSYTIVYGPKGIGKTKLVDHTAIGLKGVVKILVPSASTREEIIQSLSKKLLGNHGAPNLNFMALIEAVSNCGFIPTIIFDVDQVTSKYIDDPVLGTVRSFSKALAPYCRCIIVLSEVNAVLQFGKDKREKFIYVDEMERDEAREMLKKLKTNLSDDEMDLVFSQIGTSPVDLINLAESVSATYSVKDFIRDALHWAERDLVMFRHKAILKALKYHPEGVPAKYFNNNEMRDGVDISIPRNVGMAMKDSDAVVYRIELDKYMLLSTAHRTALKSYKHDSFFFFKNL